MTAPQTFDSAALAAALAGTNEIALADGSTMSVAAAVVLDLDGKGIQTLSQTKANVRYDINGDGLADKTSWIGTTEGFLFLDRDKNGTLTNFAEMNFLTDSPGATSGLAALKAFDTNGDGALSTADARFGDFMIWQDKNGNGVVDSGEVMTLAAAGVRSINLNGTASTTANNAGDVATIATSSYTKTNGTTQSVLDAALTYLSAPSDGLPSLAFAEESFDRKAKKYRITAKDGQLFVTGKYVPNTIDSRAGGLNGSFEIHFRNTTIGMLSAIVLDLDGNGVSMTNLGKYSPWFDMNGDGSPDRTGWISKHDGFLVIDRNNNGKIDNGAELSMLAEDSTAITSLGALAKLDSNGDKIIDSSDARFNELKVWVDANSNGVVDAGELKSLSDLGIQSINLSAHNVNGSVKPGGNILIDTATFTRTNGLIGTVGDVALAFSPSTPDPARAAALYTPNSVQPVSTTSSPTAGVTSISAQTAAAQLTQAIASFGVSRATSELSSTLTPPQLNPVLAAASTLII